MKIALIPIDDRPVCYQLPEMISKIDDTFELCLPERKYLGNLEKQADIDNLFEWLETLPELDGIVLSLDTLAYGGLVSSRRCPESFEDIKKRVEKLKEILISKKGKVYAFSSIMRIANNNYNIEEKPYWSQYGTEIFKYSYNTHKTGRPQPVSVPDEILNDYLATRKRNFEINKIYLEWQKEGLLDILVFSKDDCAQYGFNVQEAAELETSGAYVKTGADEIPLSLLARMIGGNIRICPVFLEPEYKNLISNYEDISIEKSVQGQLELAGCEISDEENADILLIINNFEKNQGEIVMKIDTKSFGRAFKVPDKSYMAADVRFANGADNNFVNELLFNNKISDETFYGYSGWNTSANTLGSLIFAAKTKFFAKKYNKLAFKKLQTVRFLDDWAYQANVRQTLASPDIEELNTRMKAFEKRLENVIIQGAGIKYSFPWHRLFEVEIEFS